MDPVWESRLNKITVVMLCACLCMACGVATVELRSFLAFLAMLSAGAGGICTAATIR